MLKQDILPYVNLFGYVEIGASRTGGGFIEFLQPHLQDQEAAVLTHMGDRNDIIPVIKDLLGTGQ